MAISGVQRCGVARCGFATIARSERYTGDPIGSDVYDDRSGNFRRVERLHRAVSHAFRSERYAEPWYPATHATKCG